MLWTKGWLETRLLFLYSLVLFAVNMAAEFARLAKSSGAGDTPAVNDFLLLWVLLPALLAGNGIHTPTRFRGGADAHRSLYYTLSLPVSRFRLLAVRTVLGIGETVVVVLVVVGTLWTLLPAFRTNATPGDAIYYVLTLLAYTSGFYCLSVLVASFIEGPWRLWGTFLLILVARWAMMQLPVHPLDILAPIASAAPLLTHVVSWKAVGICIGLSAICFGAASKVIGAREY